jgi:hypothetical protein
MRLDASSKGGNGTSWGGAMAGNMVTWKKPLLVEAARRHREPGTGVRTQRQWCADFLEEDV